MKILAISDEECPALWDFYTPGRLDGYDLILSCGDLNAKYLSFLVTMAKCPVLYVHGNHDVNYDQVPPEGCDCIDGDLVTVKGLRIMGLGGSMMYSGGPHQYTEQQMERRIRRMKLKLMRTGGVDIILTHAPARGYGDQEDPAHRGFEAFFPLLDKYRPQYLIHGHVHKRYSSKMERVLHYGDTTIINASGRYVLEIPDKN